MYWRLTYGYKNSPAATFSYTSTVLKIYNSSFFLSLFQLHHWYHNTFNVYVNFCTSSLLLLAINYVIYTYYVCIHKVNIIYYHCLNVTAFLKVNALHVTCSTSVFIYYLLNSCIVWWSLTLLFCNNIAFCFSTAPLLCAWSSNL